MYTFHGINNYDYDHIYTHVLLFHESPMYQQYDVVMLFTILCAIQIFLTDGKFCKEPSHILPFFIYSYTNLPLLDLTYRIIRG